ncbi:M1 family metallopeptidase [Nocardioides caeni]|uniref:M1 family metallopeptidase n=1 Tax=Nocardioides caeni TaxID=574700 RepID=A0A4S8N357_9ACTN|nr:M1 family metallopeptidase [Nocardioides caeni]THV09349.1 M1 family metallopeptidase [Nocardioides caeni]
MALPRHRTRAAVIALVGTGALAACGPDAGLRSAEPSPRPEPTVTSTPSAHPLPGPYGVARNDLREDSVYPAIGEPVVDALHYDLDLTWVPDRDLLIGRETILFRAAATSTTIPLDLSSELEVARVRLDGRPVDFEHTGTTLVIEQPVTADDEHQLTLAYEGTPAPTPAPSERSDFEQGLGWSITDEHETWTLQEPYGAFTWYAVNDHPSDKALYDFALTVDEPWSGVANGQLVDTVRRAGSTTSHWHLAEPAASYLVTVAFGDFQHTDLTSASGVPLQVWTDVDGEALPGETAYLPEAVDWVEGILGPYPFDSLGILVVDNTSGMETQTMITLGDTAYSLSAATIVHEVVHQWYGDTVTPDDWSDVWMNEGMAMYLQGVWEAEQEGTSVEEKMDGWAEFEPDLRADAGPPGAYDPEKFGSSNVYYGPALMWQSLRERIGDDAFFEVLREWPAARANGTADRTDLRDWIEDTTGEELSAFFDDWLLSEESPADD